MDFKKHTDVLKGQVRERAGDLKSKARAQMTVSNAKKLFLGRRSKREMERAYARKTVDGFKKKKEVDLEAETARKKPIGPQSRKIYQQGSIVAAAAVVIVFGLLIQGLREMTANLHGKDQGFFHNYGGIPQTLFLMFVCFFPLWGLFRWKMKVVWEQNNTQYINDDLTTFDNEAFLRQIDHLVSDFRVAPDAGLGYDGTVMVLASHIMMKNDGIKKIMMPVYDKTVDGFVKKDINGDVVKEKVPMFDHDFGEMLYDMSDVPAEYQKWYSGLDYDYNPLIPRREGGDGKRRVGGFQRKNDPYDTLADFINANFHPLDWNTQRPAGVYFYDDAPVNVILIAITRGGKGQTYIEVIFDLWIRADNPWNIFTTDPKMELLRKFYYPATKAGFEVVQFNLMVPNLSNVFNPLINALQEFRRNDVTKAVGMIDAIVAMLFPDNGEIWNPAAGNMLRRIVYLLFDYLIEQEKYVRYVGYRDNIPQEIVDEQVEDIYSKISMYSVYVLLGELAAKVSTDLNFINVDPTLPPEDKKDLLTLVFEAMSMLPRNELRVKSITANNAIKQISGAEQTVASIYATLLTGLSVYDDPTTIALMSGGLSDSFDVSGVGFPRRIGVRFDKNYVSRYGFANANTTWTAYEDAEFTKPMDVEKYGHIENVSMAGWSWLHIVGKYPNRTTYLTLDVSTSGTRVARFYFRFIKGYRKRGQVAYVRDEITNDLIVKDGVLIEMQKEGDHFVDGVSQFEDTKYDALTKSFVQQQSPVIDMTQVFYSERPKFMFAVVPPHLQHYQKHVLTIFSQLVNEFYDLAYTTKSAGKPIVGLHVMLEELGNIRDGERGIANLDTITSIALGQDLQLTFVLQAYQQLRDIYGEAVEAVIRANSAYTVFLKSNDKELIEDLIYNSGIRHEVRVNGKNVTRRPSDVITPGEAGIGYNINNEETSTIKVNDLLFLPGKNPGNGAVFSQTGMPIVNKLDTITPMAAGLHGRLPQPVAGKYTKSTLPTTANRFRGSDSLATIDGEALVKARVAHAKIAQTIKEDALLAANKAGIKLDEYSAELSEYIMNAVYDEYNRENGISYTTQSKPVEYWQVSRELLDNFTVIGRGDYKNDDALRQSKIQMFKEGLLRCLMDPQLNEVTMIFRDKQADGAFGFEIKAVQEFLKAFVAKYPEPEKLEVEKRDVFEEAKREGWEKKEVREYVFDAFDNSYTGQAVADLCRDLLMGKLSLSELDLHENPEMPDNYKVVFSGMPIGNYMAKDHTGEFANSFIFKPGLNRDAVLDLYETSSGAFKEAFNEKKRIAMMVED